MTAKVFALIGLLVVLVVPVAASNAAGATASSSVPISWLAAGDSYSSGEGLPHSIGSCAQADEADSKAWADVAADDLRSANTTPRFADPPKLVACTGATSQEMIDKPDAVGTPEWNPSMGRFGLVTFTFGGDDIGFSSILEQCLGLSSLVSAGEDTLSLGAGIPYYTSPLPNDPGHTCPAASIIESRISALGTSYRSFLTAVANDVVVPGGNVVVLGYPDLIELPKFWSWWEQTIGSCWGIGTGDATELRGLAGDLNATIGAAVAAINAQAPDGVHFTFVDVNTANDGNPSNDPNLFEPSSGARHNLCSSDPWINGGSIIDYGKGSFHPKQQGLDAEGSLAATAIEKLHWNLLTTYWSNTGSIVPTGEALNAVSCTSATFCMAVGTNLSQEPDYVDAPNEFVGAFGAYRWNGSGWLQTPVPAPPSLTGGGWLDDVSCVTPTYCMATGTGLPPLSDTTIGYLNGVAELWNGQSWSDTNFPGTNASASGIACVKTGWCMSILVPGQCVACGGQVSAALWNGSSWQVTPIPGLTSPGLNQFSLSCASTSFCMTTTNLEGQIMDSALQSTQDNVSYVFDGTHWHQVGWPDQGVGVVGLSCSSATSCVQMADANYGTPGYGGGELTFLWKGYSWSEAPNPVADTLTFSSISCTSTTFCVGVGEPAFPAYNSSGGSYTGPTAFPDEAAVWTGTTWEQTPTPIAGNQQLNGVSCTSDECTAVGSTTVELVITR